MRLTAEIRYDADPARVYAMLVDPAFQERKLAATKPLSSDVRVEPKGDGTAGAVIRSRREMPTDEVPDIVRKLVGSSLTIVQVEDWGPAAADGSRTGELSVEVEKAPVGLTGTLRLTPSGGGTVELVEGDLKARVPVIGGKIERSAEPAIMAAIQVEQRTGTAWLAERG